MAEAAREPGTGKTGSAALNFTELAALGLSLRPSTEADQAFEQALFVSFRAEELALVPWPQAQKDAFCTSNSACSIIISSRIFPAPISGSSIDRCRPARMRLRAGSISTVRRRHGT
jgi:hypothetical protein